MKVIVPATHVSAETLAAIRRSGHIACVAKVGGSDTAYWELLNTLWNLGEDFTLVEQDIVVGPDTLTGFEQCPNNWCCAPYPYLGSDKYAGNGCTRIRAQLIRECPQAMSFVGQFDYAGHGPKHWCTLDAAMQTVLQQRYLQRRCLLHEPVGHLHDEPSHGCVPGYPNSRV